MTKNISPSRRARRNKGLDASTVTHRELTERFNALVPRAKKLGITWARHHTSAFESKALGVRMLAKWRRRLPEVTNVSLVKFPLTSGSHQAVGASFVGGHRRTLSVWRRGKTPALGARMLAKLQEAITRGRD